MSFFIGMQDESLQSYVFRILHLNGENDFSSVIANDGSWNVLVQVSKEHAKYFLKKSEVRLLELIKKNYEKNITVNYYNNPFYHLELYKYFFGNLSNEIMGKIRLQMNTPKRNIKFCEECLMDGIEIHGFAHFRTLWDTNNFCKTHNTKLYYLPPSNKKQSIYNIRLILKGEIPSTAIKLPNETISNEQENFPASPIDYLDYYISNKKEEIPLDCVRKHFYAPMTPCLLEIMTHKLRRIVHDYLYEINGEIKHQKNFDISMLHLYNNLIYKKGVYKKINADMINRSINTLIEQNHIDFLKFLDNLYEEVVATNIIDTEESCAEKMIAPIIRQCDKCKHPKVSCALSKKIISFVQPKLIQHAKRNNYCDRSIINSAERYPENIDFTTPNIEYIYQVDFKPKQYEFDLTNLIS